MRLANMRVLVTGTDGYIGVVLASFLLQRGYDIVGLDTGFFRDAWLYNNGVSTLPSVKNKDLRRMTADDVAGMDAVVHLAELSNDPLGQLSPHITYAIIIRAVWPWRSCAKQRACHVLSIRHRVASMASAGGVSTKPKPLRHNRRRPM